MDFYNSEKYLFTTLQNILNEVFEHIYHAPDFTLHTTFHKEYELCFIIEDLCEYNNIHCIKLLSIYKELSIIFTKKQKFTTTSVNEEFQNTLYNAILDYVADQYKINSLRKLKKDVTITKLVPFTLFQITKNKISEMCDFQNLIGILPHVMMML